MGIIHSTMCAFSFVIERILSWLLCACLSACLLVAMVTMCMYGVSAGYHYAQREIAQWQATFKYYHKQEYKNFEPEYTRRKAVPLNDSSTMNSTLLKYNNISRKNEILDPLNLNASVAHDLHKEGISNVNAENQTGSEFLTREKETTALAVSDDKENGAVKGDEARTQLKQYKEKWNIFNPNEMFLYNTSETGLNKMVNYFTAFLPF